MSWYVLQCREGQEEMIIRSCRQRLSFMAMEKAFSFCCERLWRVDGKWEPMRKKMFPGYVFLESSYPDLLFVELEQYREFLKVMEEPGYLFSVYADEEQNLRKLCGNYYYLGISYGYKKNGTNYITGGPLKGMENQVIRFDWHRRFAQVELCIARKKSIIWAGLEPDKRVTGKGTINLVS